MATIIHTLHWLGSAAPALLLIAAWTSLGILRVLARRPAGRQDALHAVWRGVAFAAAPALMMIVWLVAFEVPRSFYDVALLAVPATFVVTAWGSFALRSRRRRRLLCAPERPPTPGPRRKGKRRRSVPKAPCQETSAGRGSPSPPPSGAPTQRDAARSAGRRRELVFDD